MTAFMGPVRVLIVDDVPGLRRLLRFVLGTDKLFEVVGEAPDGLSAIEAAARLHPEMVLLDLSMPTMDGLEALPLIKETSPESSVVVFSGFMEDRMGPMALSLGAVGYMEKGGTPEQILAELRKVVMATRKPESVVRFNAGPGTPVGPADYKRSV